MRRRIRFTLACLGTVAPRRIKRLIYRKCLGWDIHPSANIGISFIFVDNLIMQANASISHGNVLKGCELVQMGKGAKIGALNWISAPTNSPEDFADGRSPQLLMGRDAKITNRHLIDCTDSVELCDFAVLAGNRSQILTHGPRVQTAVQSTAPVVIGRSAVVFTASILLAGAKIPCRSVVAAGAVVVGPLDGELWVYAGVPARRVKRLPEESAYFQGNPSATDEE